MIRLASAIWQAGLKEGTGFITTESGALKEAPYSDDFGVERLSATNPEELIAAAVASSYSMSLSAEMDRACLIAEKIRTAAGVTLEQLERGWSVTRIHLEVRVKLVKDDLERFEAATRAAKAGCSIAQLLNAKFTVDAQLESWQSFGEIERKNGTIPLGKRLVSIRIFSGTGNKGIKPRQPSRRPAPAA